MFPGAASCRLDHAPLHARQVALWHGDFQHALGDLVRLDCPIAQLIATEFGELIVYAIYVHSLTLITYMLPYVRRCAATAEMAALQV